MSVLLILAATLLPTGTAPIDLAAQRWCIDCGGPWAADAVCNILLFVPLGVALASLRSRASQAAVIGGLLSFLLELAQSLDLPPGRSSSFVDVLANSLGSEIGWGLFRVGPRLWQARGGRAFGLGLCWWFLGLLVLFGTAAAVQRGADSSPRLISTSPYQHSPIYGWYGGNPQLATIGASADEQPLTILHRGSGPIVAAADSPSETWLVRVWTAGRDTARYRRALFYLHLLGDSTPELVISQNDGAAELLVRRRAQELGLVFPTLTLARVFGQVKEDDRIDLQIGVHPARVELTGNTGAGARTAALDLSPAIGWTLLQSVVGIAHPLASLVALAWLTAIFLPVSWWLTRSGNRFSIILSGTAIAVSTLGVSALFSVAPFSTRDILFVCAIGGVGIYSGRRSQAGVRQPPVPPKLPAVSRIS
ncbi:MAG: VanZ family protein [Gemmatimonadaceae bacterium]|nr:VanZ family protein [Gemmatimonadaceae bacterium]